VSTPPTCSSRPAAAPASPSPWDAPDRPWITRPASRSTRPLEFELLSRRHFLTREQARHAVAAWIDEYNTDRRHSTKACSARSTTNAPAQHNVEPSTASTNTTVGRRHEPQRDGFAAAVSPRPRRAEATGPPLTRKRCGQGAPCPPHRAALSTNNQDQIPTNQVSTVSGDCHGSCAIAHAASPSSGAPWRFRRSDFGSGANRG